MTTEEISINMDDMSLLYNANFCRICQIPDNLDLLDTSTTAFNGETLLDILKDIFCNIDWIDDHLISVTCRSCFRKIIEIAEFKRICLETNLRRSEAVKLDNKDKFELVKVETKVNEKPESEVSYQLRKKRKDVQTLNKLNLSENEKPKRKRNHGRVKPKTRTKKKLLYQSEESDVSNDTVERNIQEDSQEIDSLQIDQQIRIEKTCRVCKRKLPSFERLKKHAERVHPNHLFYNCDTCEESFASREYWERHEFKHGGTKKYICTFCGAKYITRSDLTHHMHNHKDEAKYVCKICPDKKFQTSNSLMKHKMLVHTDHKEYKHECSQCGLKFGMISGLRVHLLRHANIREFSCHICGKTFCTSHELKNHAVTHSNVRPFKCDLCPAEYKLKSVLQKHKFKMHGIGNYKHSTARKYSCPYCSKNVSSKCKLERHIRAHTGTKPFKCRLCDTKFICKSYVKGHVKGKHSIDVDAFDFNVKAYFDVNEAENASG